MDTLQGPEWDSSDEEAEEKVKAKTTEKAKKTTKESTKKGAKKAKNEAKEDETEKDATVLYVGHLPGEFEERDLKNFLQQFGKVVNIRISRSPKTGNSRGYAFVRWEDAETARVAADTLQGYFVGQRRLVCHPVPNPHQSMFYHTDKAIQRSQLKQKVEAKQRERKLANVGKIKEITARLVQREHKKREKLEALGIDYDFPGYEASQMDDVEDEVVEDKMDVQEDEAPQSDKKGKKKRKDSVGSVESASSTPSRKDSVGSESSATKKAKRKDSVGSEVIVGSAGSSGKKKSKKTIAMEEDSADATPTKSTKKDVQSEKKAKKSKQNKKRRESAP